MEWISQLTFAQPWILTALALLPVIYWLVKVMPPKPRKVIFPAFQFLVPLENKDESTNSTPWWLLLLRLFLVTLVITALAEPRLNDGKTGSGEGPLVLLVDNGWSAAPTWEKTENTLRDILSADNNSGRLIYLIPLAPEVRNIEALFRPQRAKNLLEDLQSLRPVSWPSDRKIIEELSEQFRSLSAPEFIWLSDSIANQITENEISEIVDDLSLLGPVSIIRGYPEETPILLKNIRYSNGKVQGTAQFSSIETSRNFSISAKSATGQNLYKFDVLQLEQSSERGIEFEMPLSIFNKTSSFEIVGSSSAGSRFFIDSRQKRKNAGLAVIGNDDVRQALLSENHYLSKALAPYYFLQENDMDQLLIDNQTSLIFLGDTGALENNLERNIRDWISAGGMLVRFAGPKLANTKSELLPIRLREGSRNLDGSISWTKPARLGAFPNNSPFSALSIPKDVKVRKQVLAFPEVNLNEKTWALLEDGTPLVTSEKIGNGYLILFHTTATPKWSNLVLSGLFVEMLREIGQISTNNPNALLVNKEFKPYRVMDGFGQLRTPSTRVQSVTFGGEETPSIGPITPAGLYGDEDKNVALNVGQNTPYYIYMDFGNVNADLEYFGTSNVQNLKAPLLVAAFILFLLDMLAVMIVQGRLFPVRKAPAAAALLLFAFLIQSKPVDAQELNRKVLEATLDTRLAFIITGDNAVDQMSAAGMAGLSRVLNNRTSIETAAPHALDIERDDLIFYPFVYWPVIPEFEILSSEATKKISTYLRTGGTILFDTRNQNKAARYGGNLSLSPENIRLQQIIAKLDIPRLQIVPNDHVLTKSFYLMQTFPGRFDNGKLWITATSPDDGNDGVSPVIIGSNDWAAAWAINQRGRPIAALIPDTPRQREMARRFGVNLTMYTVTGSYKNDQVHIPQILDRLSQ